MTRRILASAVIAATVFFLIVACAHAAPTSTIVQNLIIAGLQNAPCTKTDSTGLVGSTTCGGGGSSTLIYAGNQFLLVQQVGGNATLTPISVLSVTSSADISPSSATGTAITFTFLNPKGFTTTTIQSVLNSLSASGIASYNSSTGVFNVSNTGNWAGTWGNRTSSDFLASSTNLAPSTTIPTQYVATNTGNWAGTWQNRTSSDFLASSTNLAPSTTIPTSYVRSFNGATGTITGVNSVNNATGTVTVTSTRSATKIICASNSIDTVDCDYLGTGTNDDVKAKAALTALASTGGLVNAMDGTLLVGSPVVVSSSANTLTGQGWATVYKAKVGLNGYVISVDNSSSSLIKNNAYLNLKIDGDKLDQSSGGCFDASGTAAAIFDRVWFTGCHDYGLILGGTASGTFGFNNSVVNSRFDNSAVGSTSVGIYTTRNDENTFINDVTSDWTGFHYVENSGSTAWIGDTLVGGSNATSGVGIEVLNTSYDRIIGSMFDALWQQALYLNGADHTLASDNTITRVSGAVTSTSAIYNNNSTYNAFVGDMISGGQYYKYGYEETGTAGNNLLLGDFIEPGLSGTVYATGSTQVYFTSPSSTLMAGNYWGGVESGSGNFSWNVPSGKQYNVFNGGQPIISVQQGGIAINSTTTNDAGVAVQIVATGTNTGLLEIGQQGASRHVMAFSMDEFNDNSQIECVNKGSANCDITLKGANVNITPASGKTVSVNGAQTVTGTSTTNGINNTGNATTTSLTVSSTATFQSTSTFNGNIVGKPTSSFAYWNASGVLTTTSTPSSSGVATSSLGAYAAGNLSYFINSSTISGTSSLFISSGTGQFAIGTGTVAGEFLVSVPSSTTAFEVATSGIVGIGGMNTNYPLWVTGNFNASGLMGFENTNSLGYSSIDLYNDAGTKIGGFGVGGTSTNPPYRGNFYLGTNASNQNIDLLGGGGATPTIQVAGTSQVSINSTATSSLLYVNGSSTFNGHLGFSTSSVTVSAGATITGSDMVGSITNNSSTASDTITFVTKWTNNPVCFAQVSSGTAAAYTAKSTTSTLNLTPASAIPTSTIISYSCSGNPN